MPVLHCLRAPLHLDTVQWFSAPLLKKHFPKLLFCSNQEEFSFAKNIEKFSFAQNREMLKTVKAQNSESCPSTSVYFSSNSESCSSTNLQFTCNY